MHHRGRLDLNKILLFLSPNHSHHDAIIAFIENHVYLRSFGNIAARDIHSNNINRAVEVRIPL